VEGTRPNLAITDLSPLPGTRAAGVPLLMKVAVKNFSDAPVKDVVVLLQADGNVRPAIQIPRIPPGEVVAERFPVRFAAAGQHVITARLETDVVAVDNVRYRVVDLPEDVPVLLVDGAPEARDAHYLSAALAPGGPAPTGIRPRIERPRFLSVQPLEPFSTVYLLNVGQLDALAVEALEAFVRSGGGLAIFLGERCRSKFINDALYREGRGLFPVAIGGQAELLVDRLQNAPDLEVGRHPIFRVFAGTRNNFIATVTIQRYFSVPEEWEPEPDSQTRVIARLRNGAPLALEREYGDGRVVAFLTTAGPAWNNWARNNPSFVVAMLELQAFVARRPSEDTSKRVGTPIELQMDPSQYDAEVRFSMPDDYPPSGGYANTPSNGGAARETDRALRAPSALKAALGPGGSKQIAFLWVVSRRYCDF
jgi:hypothetical protein